MRKIPDWIKYVFVFGIGVLLGYEAHNFSGNPKNNQDEILLSQTNKEARNESNNKTKNEASESGNSKREIENANIPRKVLEVLKYIDNNDAAPDGYVGGRKFKNLERLLPQKADNGRRVNYREWDVNPKTAGQNRGRERLVTGDDRSAYYTNDHYSSFQKIR
jgi:ribonuclease T1